MTHPSYCCSKCGEQIGYIGRFFQFLRIPLHRCKKMIDYELVTKHLIKHYKDYPQIWMDFCSLPGKIVIHKIRWENGKMIEGQPTSYDYKGFESITERLKNDP